MQGRDILKKIESWEKIIINREKVKESIVHKPKKMPTVFNLCEICGNNIYRRTGRFCSRQCMEIYNKENNGKLTDYELACFEKALDRLYNYLTIK